MREGAQSHHAASSPRKRTGTRCTEDLMGLWVGLDGCGKFRSFQRHQYSLITFLT